MLTFLHFPVIFNHSLETTLKVLLPSRDLKTKPSLKPGKVPEPSALARREVMFVAKEAIR
jgi:hypothetical protein